MNPARRLRIEGDLPAHLDDYTVAQILSSFRRALRLAAMGEPVVALDLRLGADSNLLFKIDNGRESGEKGNANGASKPDQGKSRRA